MRYQFIAEQGKEHEVERMCALLGVSRSGYYAWRKRGVSRREEANRELGMRIRKEFMASRKTYGSPRIQLALQRAGMRHGKQRIARLMRLEGLQARPRRKRRPLTTQATPGVVPAPNLLNRDFGASRPNEKWVSDFTYIATHEGWLYLAVVLDLFSRQVIGWSMRETMDVELVQAALDMALLNRQPAPGLLHHSDQGSQYTAGVYLDCLRAAQTQLSMSRPANCYDNAAMESFFSTLKFECATEPFPSRAVARSTIFEYLEVWYNRQRMHSTLGYLCPVDFERRFSL